MSSGGSRASKVFDISVGAVVPHRHRRIGRSFAYATAQDLPRWGVVRRFPERRRFKGSVVSAPFVAVRRTSSPRDRERVVGTLVVGRRPVAVENHLIVFHPKDGTIKACKKLLALLRLPATRKWVDSRLRSRHLTVNVLRDLPWLEE
jgi:hypothetical protein